MTSEKKGWEGLRALFHSLVTPFVVWITNTVWLAHGLDLVTVIFVVFDALRAHCRVFRYYLKLAVRKFFRFFGRFVRWEKFLYFYLIGKIARESEKNKMTGIGPMLVGLSVARAIVVPERYWTVVWSVSLLDPAARVAGKTLGGPKFFGAEKKTCAGFLGALVMGVAVARFQGCPWAMAMLSGLAGATGEMLGCLCDDNLLIPILIALAINFLS